jgi:DNA-binding protein H-NS
MVNLSIFDSKIDGIGKSMDFKSIRQKWSFTSGRTTDIFRACISFLITIALFFNPGIIEAIIHEKGDLIMAEEPQTICEWLDIDLNKLSTDDKINLIGEISDELTAQQIIRVREMVNQKRLSKIEEAKAQVIEEMRKKFVQLDLDFDELFEMRRGRRGKSQVPPKYRGPDGKEWSGRGNSPFWIREYEEAGGDREDYRITDES